MDSRLFVSVGEVPSSTMQLSMGELVQCRVASNCKHGDGHTRKAC